MEKRDLFMHLLTMFTVCSTICLGPLSQCALLGVCSFLKYFWFRVFVVVEVSL